MLLIKSKCAENVHMKMEYQQNLLIINDNRNPSVALHKSMYGGFKLGQVRIHISVFGIRFRDCLEQI